MESSTKYFPQNSRKRVFPATSSLMEPEVTQIPPSTGDCVAKLKLKSKNKALKGKEVTINEIIDIDMDDDCDEVMLIGRVIESNKKGKDTNATISSQLEPMDHVQPSKKSFASGIKDFDLDGSGCNGMDLYAGDYTFDDEYSILQSHFDNIAIPSGVEAPIPWFQDCIVKTKNKMSSGTGSACSATRAIASGTHFVQSASPSHERTSSSSAGHLHKMEPAPFGPSVSTPLKARIESNKKGKDASATSSSEPSSATQLDPVDHVQSSKKSFASRTSFDKYSILQSHFDNIAVPSGVEAPIPWFQDRIVKMKNKMASGPTCPAARAIASGTHFVQSTSASHKRSGSSSASHLHKMEPASAGRSVNSPLKAQVQDRVVKMKNKMASGPTCSASRTVASRTHFVQSASASHERSGSSSASHLHKMEPASAGRSGRSSLHRAGPYFPHISNTQGRGTGAKRTSQLPMDLVYPPVKATSLGPVPFMKKYEYLDDAYPPIFPNAMEDMLLDQDLGGGRGESGSASIIKNEENSGSSFSMVQQLSIDYDVTKKYEDLMKFDTVQDHSDHHFSKIYPETQQPPRNWAKKIQEEWRILEKELPDTIFVRVYESRMDLLRAVIIGAEGTPYHDGLFFFDVYFPPSYPSVPPCVHYHSGGLHINPNLYWDGKVCLSLLNTWYGDSTEMWVPGFSTMLQVLVSIQGLILNAKPYFNEPARARLNGSVDADSDSLRYNEEILILSLKTMVYTMKRPPKNFEELVVGHFRSRVRDILMACKAYIEGAQVGCLVRGDVQDVNGVCESSCAHFKNNVASYIKILVNAFKRTGAKDAEEFLYLSEKTVPLTAEPLVPLPRFSSEDFPTYNYDYPAHYDYPTQYW